MTRSFLTRLFKRSPKANHVTGAQRGRGTRVVTLLGAEPEHVDALVRVLFSGEEGGFFPLLAAQSPPNALQTASAKDTPETPENGVEWLAVHVEPDRRARYRWWIHVPQSAAGTGPEEVPWRLDSDTILIAWPCARGGASGSVGADDVFRLSSACGHARKLGRLRRVGVVIVEGPAEGAALHSSQAFICLPADQPLPLALSRQLAVAVHRPGEPLADPRLRGLLQSVLLGDRALLGLLENLRGLLGTEVPVFFAAGSGPSPGLRSLLSWVQHGRARAPRGAARVLRRMTWTAASVLALAFLAVLLLPGPRGARLGRPAAAPTSRDMHGYWRGYRWPVGAVLRDASAEPLVERALQLSQVRDRATREGARLDSLTVALTADASRAGWPERVRRADSLETAIRMSTDTLRALGGAAEPTGADSSNLESLKDAVAGATLASALLRCVRRDDGYSGVWLAPVDSTRAHQFLAGVCREPVGATLDSLLASRHGAQFYQGLAARCASDDGVGRAFALGARGAPVIATADAFQDGTNGRPLSRLVQLHRLEQVCSLSSPGLRDWVDCAPEHCDRAAQALAPLRRSGRTEVVLFVQGNDWWHVDVLEDGRSHWIPAVPAHDADGRYCCRYTVGKGGLGGRLRLRLNRHERDHVDAGPCPGPERDLVLGEDGGELEFPGDVRVVWEVVPQSGVVASTH